MVLLSACTPALQEAWTMGLLAYTLAMPGHDCLLTQTTETTLDFCVTVEGKVSWDLTEYTDAAPYFEAQGLTWGGRGPMDERDYTHLTVAA